MDRLKLSEDGTQCVSWDTTGHDTTVYLWDILKGRIIGWFSLLRSAVVETCDELYHFRFSIDRIGIPFGFQTIKFTFQFLPWVVLWLLFSLTNSPLFRVRFGESLFFRLYSETDHIHLSSEAQCVSHHLLPGDCHTYQMYVTHNINQTFVGLMLVKL